MPGVTANTTDELYIGNSAPAGTAATLPYSVNGNRNSANNWTVDGADNVDRGSNLTLMTFPSIDSIAEFKVERSLYTADTGRAGGAQIAVVSKSGTAQFHGDLYEFVRNNDFAANNWINNAEKVAGERLGASLPPLRWNDFGGTIGGPVPLGPKDKHKTFFFFSEEARRIITYTTFNPVLPTAAMLQGTFSQPVCITYTIFLPNHGHADPGHFDQSDCGRVHQGYLRQNCAFGDQLGGGNLFRILRTAQSLQQHAGDCAHRPHLQR